MESVVPDWKDSGRMVKGLSCDGTRIYGILEYEDFYCMDGENEFPIFFIELNGERIYISSIECLEFI